MFAITALFLLYNAHCKAGFGFARRFGVCIITEIPPHAARKAGGLPHNTYMFITNV